MSLLKDVVINTSFQKLVGQSLNAAKVLATERGYIATGLNNLANLYFQLVSFLSKLTGTFLLSGIVLFRKNFNLLWIGTRNQSS